MHRLFGLILAGGLVLGVASGARAQISVSVGNPYTGSGITLGQPYGAGYSGAGLGGYYGSPYAGSPLYSPAYAPPLAGATAYSYSSGYGGYAAPVSSYYSSGYYGSGYSGAYPATSFTTSAYPGYGYSGYGYAPAYGTGVWRRGLLGGWRGRMRWW